LELLRRPASTDPVFVAEAHSPDEILIEDPGMGTALVAELQEAGRSAIAVKPELDKVPRMSIQSGKFESGRVHFPDQAPWLADLKTELFAWSYFSWLAVGVSGLMLAIVSAVVLHFSAWLARGIAHSGRRATWDPSHEGSLSEDDCLLTFPIWTE
jgi:hypothetical protein